MKRFRKLCFVLSLLVLTLGVSMIRPVSTQAAAKKGLVKVKKKYYFYKNGKKIKNKWKTVKDKTDGRKYRFYFGKKGAAYKAADYGDESIKLFKIGKKKYGFDSSSHLAAPGIYTTSSFKVVVIGKKGVYNEKKTASIRKKLKLGSKLDKSIYKKVTDILGKPVSEKRSVSCDPWDDTATYTDVLLEYPYVEVQLIQNDKTKAYGLNGIFAKAKE